MSIFEKMKRNYDNKVQYAAILHKYALLKKALHSEIIYPIDKKYWEECLSVYEANLKRGNKNTSKLGFLMMKEEYALYLELLNKKEKNNIENKKE